LCSRHRGSLAPRGHGSTVEVGEGTMAKRWMCVMLTVGWLGVCASAMAQALPAFAPQNAPPPNGGAPGAPGCPPAPQTDVIPAIHSPEPEPTGPECQFRVDYLLWAIPRQSLSRYVSTGSLSDPIPGAIGQPNTRFLLNGRFGDDTPHSGIRLYASLGEDSNPHLSLNASAFYLERRESKIGFSADGIQNTTLIARPFQNVNAGVEDADPIALPGIMSGAIRVLTDKHMYGGEANLKFHYWEGSNARIAFTIGPRFLFLEELLLTMTRTDDLTIMGVPGFSTSSSERYSTDNDFYGAQVGAEWQFRVGPCALTTTAKCAIGPIFQNLNTRAQTAVTDNLTGIITTSQDRALFLSPNNVGNFSRTHFCVVPELGARLGFDFTTNVGISVGYSYVYMSDVIRPAEQVDRNVNVQPIGTTGIFPPARTPPALRSTSISAQGLDASVLLRF